MFKRVLFLAWLTSVMSPVGCAIGETEPLVILYAHNLSQTKINWAHKLGDEIESCTGLEVEVRRASFFSSGEDAWLLLTGEAFRESSLGDYATISLENKVGKWLNDTLGMLWLAPGEVVSTGIPDPIPFKDWINRSGNLINPSFKRRDLLDTDGYWSKMNGLYRQKDRSHLHYKLIRPEHFDSNPEWFAKDENGIPQRPPFKVLNQHTDHPDLLNNDVVRIVAQAVKKAFRRNPNLWEFSILPNDSYVFSHIPEEYNHLKSKGYYSRLEDYSNYVFDFGNRVAKQVLTEFPNKSLFLSAYMCWLNVPTVKLHPSISTNVADDRTQWYDREYKERDLALLESWNNSGVTSLGITDYFFGTDFLIPRSLVSILSETIPGFHKQGFLRYRSFVAPLWGYDAHTTWLAAQLCWDAEADPAELLEKFFNLYYGPAAEQMRGFFDAAERIWMEQPGKGIWLRYWQNSHQASLYGDAELEELERWLMLAEAEAAEFQGDHFSDYIRRVEYTRDLFDLTKTFIELVQLRWAVSLHGYDGFTPAFRPYELKDVDLSLTEGMSEGLYRMERLEEQLRDGIEQAVAKSPLHKRLDRMDWMYSDSSASRIRGLNRKKADGITLIRGWSDYGTRWKTKHIDSEGVSIELNEDILRAENVFRGYTYRLAYAEEGKTYRAEVPVKGKVGPSSMVYVKLDFYNEGLELTGSSRWDRLAPGTYDKPFTIGPEMIAPEESKYVRLYIRFFQQEPGDWLDVHEPMLYEFR